ncbi:hypothetical protein LIER_32088 [Lithospermum erythrorhizon]|uniref:Uncharacterized protein n=1 Tax=Lithospermum erythrorhizon TaxID=34254 RepID=A0AAV3RW11_LITER
MEDYHRWTTDSDEDYNYLGWYIEDDMTDEEKKKAQKAGASTIEVPIKDVDKVKLSELLLDELKKVSLNAKAITLLHNAM